MTPRIDARAFAELLAGYCLEVRPGEQILVRSTTLAAPLLLAGARNPVLMFLLPRDILVPLARTHWLRSSFRFVRRPAIAVASSPSRDVSSDP